MQSVKRAQNSNDEAEELRRRARNCNSHGIDTTNRTEPTHRNDVFCFLFFIYFILFFSAAIGAYDSILFSAKTTWQNCEELSSVQYWLAGWLADWQPG